MRDAGARASAVVAVGERFAEAGVPVVAIVASRLPGREGNREIFVHAVRGATGLERDTLRLAAQRAAA